MITGNIQNVLWMLQAGFVFISASHSRILIKDIRFQVETTCFARKKVMAAISTCV